MIDVFRIGVHIGMTSNSGDLLGVMLRDLGRVDGAVSALRKNFAGLKTLAIGAFAVLAGSAALKGIWDMVEASKELNKQLENVKLMGGTAADQDKNYAGRVGELRQTAFNTSAQVPQITPAENVKILREASGQFGIDVAEKLSVKLAQLEAQLQRDGKGGNLLEGLKGIDQIGGIFTKGPHGEEVFDTKLIGGLLDKMRRGITASGGLLGPSDYLAFAKQAGLSAKQMDSDAIFGYMTEAMIAMGSSRAGTATGSLYQQIVGGTMTQKVAAELKKRGLLHDYKVGRGGEVIPNTANVKNKELFEKNEFKWINDVVVPQLQKEGMNPRQILEEIAHLFGRQTTQRLVGEIINNKPQFERTNQLYQQAMDIGQTQRELNENDLETNLRGLQGAWKGLMQAVGEAGVPAAIKIIQGLTAAIIALELAAANHPTITTWILDLSAALATLVAVGGGITVLSVALGPFATAIRALSGAVAASEAAGVAGGLTAIGVGITSLIAPLAAAVGFIGWVGSNVNKKKGGDEANSVYGPSPPHSEWGWLGDELNLLKAEQDQKARRVIGGGKGAAHLAPEAPSGPEFRGDRGNVPSPAPGPRSFMPSPVPSLVPSNANAARSFAPPKPATNVPSNATTTRSFAPPPAPHQAPQPATSTASPNSTSKTHAISPAAPAAPMIIQGDVRLDGQKVGTWVGKTVGNTGSGGTSYDPRISPMPTGATPQ